MSHRHAALAMLSLVLPFVGAGAAAAGEVEKRVAFQLDQWVDLQASDGPVTLHRLRVARQSAGAKSMFVRPGNTQYLKDVQIQLEYTNDATRDWEAQLEIEWLDADGVAIDGYRDEENLDSESRHDEQTVTLSTLRYGLDRARTLRIRVVFQPD